MYLQLILRFRSVISICDADHAVGDKVVVLDGNPRLGGGPVMALITTGVLSTEST